MESKVSNWKGILAFNLYLVGFVLHFPPMSGEKCDRSPRPDFSCGNHTYKSHLSPAGKTTGKTSRKTTGTSHSPQSRLHLWFRVAELLCRRCFPPSSISAAPAAARATSPSSLIKQPETWINLLLTESCLHMEGSNRGILMVHKHLQWISWEDQSTVWMTNEVLPYLAALTFLLQEHLCP